MAESKPLARLADFEPLKRDGSRNLLDAALARLDNTADVGPSVPDIGTLDPIASAPILYQSVRKFGAGSFHTVGIARGKDKEPLARKLGIPTAETAFPASRPFGCSIQKINSAAAAVNNICAGRISAGCSKNMAKK